MELQCKINITYENKFCVFLSLFDKDSCITFISECVHNSDCRHCPVGMLGSCQRNRHDHHLYCHCQGQVIHLTKRANSLQIYQIFTLLSIHFTLHYISPLYSSPELKAEVSFSDRLLSVVCLSVCLFVRLKTFHIFNFFSKTTWPISTKHATKHPWVKEIQVCSNEGSRPFPRGDNTENVKLY